MAHPDLETLLNPLFSYAKQMLSKHGEFLPFGASLGPDEAPALVAAADDGAETGELIETLLGGFRRKARERSIRAAGVCVDVRVTPPGSKEMTDAICAQLEHESGECVDVFMPYRKGFLGRFKYGRIFAGPGRPRIFGGGG